MRVTTALSRAAVVVLLACSENGPLAPLLGPTAAPRTEAGPVFSLESRIVFTSTRHDPTNPEIYLMHEDGTFPQRLTMNDSGEAFGALSPDGKKIVFDSNRLRTADEPLNTSDLFVMNADGTEETWLLRGSSATWSPDGKEIAFHASASGTGMPIRPDPGAATLDSDIFVLNLDDAGVESRRNLTNDPTTVDDDPDWSPDGLQIAFTSHDVNDSHTNSITAEIYLMHFDGGVREPLTNNTEEERAPSWSPKGTQIAFMCRRGGSDFEICVMNANGSNQIQLTNNGILDATPTWSGDGERILFHRPVAGRFQLFTMRADGSDTVQLTDTSGINGFPNSGVLRVRLMP